MEPKRPKPPAGTGAKARTPEAATESLGSIQPDPTVTDTALSTTDETPLGPGEQAPAGANLDATIAQMPRIDSSLRNELTSKAATKSEPNPLPPQALEGSGGSSAPTPAVGSPPKMRIPRATREEAPEGYSSGSIPATPSSEDMTPHEGAPAKQIAGSKAQAPAAPPAARVPQPTPAANPRFATQPAPPAQAPNPRFATQPAPPAHTPINPRYAVPPQTGDLGPSGPFTPTPRAGGRATPSAIAPPATPPQVARGITAAAQPARTSSDDLAAMPSRVDLTYFERLTEEDRALIQRISPEETYSAGQNIISEGDAPNGVFFILEGRARLVTKAGRTKEETIASLEPGDIFGEGSAENRHRSASVRATAKVVALHLPIAELHKLLERRPHLRTWLATYSEQRRLAGMLQEKSPFGELSRKTLLALIDRLTPTQVQRGQTIFTEGDALGPVFIIREGSVRIHRGDKTVAYLRTGSVFGMSSCFEGVPRKATAVALADASLLTLAPRDFQALHTASPTFLKIVHAHIAGIDLEREVPAPPELAGTGDLGPGARRDRPGAVLAPTPEAPFKSADGFFIKKGRSKKIPFVFQADPSDCGAACLAMICESFGRKIPIGRIRALAQPGAEGIGMGTLVSAATELGLAARSARITEKMIDRVPLPAAVQWQNNHWVVLADLDAKRARIADPAVGEHWVPREQLFQKWTGLAALFDFTDAFAAQHTADPDLGWFSAFLRPFRGVLITAFMLAGVIAVLTATLPVLAQVIIDRIITSGATDALPAAALALGAAAAFSFASRFIQGYLLAFTASRVDASLFDLLVRRLFALPMKFFLTRTAGDLLHRLDSARVLRELIVHCGSSGSIAIAQIAASLVLLALYSPFLAAIYLTLIPLYVLAMIISARLLRPVFGRVLAGGGRSHRDQLDAILGIEAAKASGAEGALREVILDRFLALSREQFVADSRRLGHRAVLYAIGHFATVLFLWAGASLAIEGKLSIGTFVAAGALIALANQAFITLMELGAELQRGRALLARLQDVVGADPEQGRERSSLIPVRALNTGLELRGVGFRYGADGPPVLSGIDLRVAPGETIAIIGKSGAGKSTLARLIAGLLEPTEGTISIDGVDQRAINQRELRRHIGFVLQENHLFAGTVLDNIALGDDPDMERATAAAKAAAAHDFISSLPLGYATPVGDAGVRLSGGQAQRIAIARAFYKEPNIFIFDEATSSVDVESERVIQASFQSYLSGRTAFVIAHRLSTVRDATRIVVLDRGRIVESGSHLELMKRHGAYYELVNRQAGQ